MRYVVSIAGETFELDVEPRQEGGYRVRGPEGRECVVESLDPGPGLLSLRVDGQAVSVLPGQDEVRWRGERYAVEAVNWQERGASRPGAQSGGRTGAIHASMPGRIVGVLCAVGAQVAANAPLVVIEAMKMQNELCAKSDSVVRAVHVEVGQTVERGALLVELE